MSSIFRDTRHIVKSLINGVNAPARVEIPKHKSILEILISDSKSCQKHGRLVGTKDIIA